MEILIGILLAAVVAVVGLIFWLSRSRKREAEAVSEVRNLRQGRKLRAAAEEIMADPVAYEPRWIRAARLRLRDRNTDR